MVKVMMDGAARLRGLSFRARVALFAVALAAVTLPACQQDATPDLFIGPSELGLSLTLSASPDVLPLDGASQSLVSILARDGSGQVVANVTLRLQIRVGGTLQDFGQLSARTLVTGQDGRALATYTAPLDTSGVDSQTQVEILVTPVGDNYASAVQRSLAIRLVPSGTVVPPFSLTAGFRFTPSSPVKFQVVRFETNCLSATDTNCVRGPVATYAWDFGDGSTASGSTATHTYSSALTFTGHAHPDRRVRSQYERFAGGDRRQPRRPDSGVRVLAGCTRPRRPRCSSTGVRHPPRRVRSPITRGTSETARRGPA